MERAAQDGSEWQFGAIETDLALVPKHLRLRYAPEGVLQYNRNFDTNGCASRDKLNGLEAKLNYFYDNGMHPAIKNWCDDKGYRKEGKFVLSDAFIEILSGTTPTGNSMKAPVDAIYRYGVIPASYLSFTDTMTRDEYFNPDRITAEMIRLGKEFIKRIQINYEKVMGSDFLSVLEEDYTFMAGHGWPDPVKGVYPRVEGTFNHAFMGMTPEIDILDNYHPFNKQIAKNYNLFEWGYSLSITGQNPYPEEVKTLFQTLMSLGLLKYFADAVTSLFKAPMQTETNPDNKPVEITPTVPAPKSEFTTPNAEKLYNTAKACLDMDMDQTVPNMVACAASTNAVFKKAFGKAIGGLASTAEMYKALKKDSRFELVEKYEPGCIVISPTGTSTKNSPNGHVGIAGKVNIMSNNSFTGKWEQNYDLPKWLQYYGLGLGFPTYFFRVK